MRITNHPETSVKGFRKPYLPGPPEATEPQPGAIQKLDPGAMPRHLIFHNDPHRTDALLNQLYSRAPGSFLPVARSNIGPISAQALAALALPLWVLGVAIAAWLFGPVETETLVPVEAPVEVSIVENLGGNP